MTQQQFTIILTLGDTLEQMHRALDVIITTLDARPLKYLPAVSEWNSDMRPCVVFDNIALDSIRSLIKKYDMHMIYGHDSLHFGRIDGPLRDIEVILPLSEVKLEETMKEIIEMLGNP